MKKSFIIFNERLIVLEGALASLLSLVILTVIFWQVICRYLLFISTPWAEELARYMFICLSYIGAGVGVYYSQFVSIDLIDKVLDTRMKRPDKMKHILEKIGLVLMLVFLFSFAYYYSVYFLSIARFGQRSAAMKMNMLFPMSFILIGTVCMAIHGFCLLITSNEERKQVKLELATKKRRRDG